MKKLRLEDLDVESFDTTRVPEEQRGTVQGHSGGLNSCFCASFANCSGDSGCHPYTCSESYDYTFCGCDTEYDYTCRTQC
ncbi:MAG TPA: hypothetical protein VGX50_17735 [Longimicrobium sp.]|jgi:hypothetical protein|nr:hypothetical protein [Longimicrobium sp.]